MEQITLTSSMRTNLLSLKRTASLLDVTENRLSTGQKINSALDGPSSFYTAKSLTNRASDLMSLLDAMGQGVQTIKAATQGVETATSLLEQMQSIANAGLSSSEKHEPLVFNPFYDGRGDTAKLVASATSHPAAEAAAAYKVAGVGSEYNDWYLPAIGELMDMWGTDTAEMTDYIGKTGAAVYADSNMKKINDTLTAIGGETMYNKGYWSSSEAYMGNSWELTVRDGYRYNYTKSSSDLNARSFQLLENRFGAISERPNIADVVYINADGDLAHGTAAEFNSAKSEAVAAGKDVTALGVVAWVSYDGRSVKIAALTDAGGGKIQWGGYGEDTELKDWHSSNFITAAQQGAVISGGDATYLEHEMRFNRALEQYNSLINDSSYKGINLLGGNSLSVSFNETRDSKYTVSVGDISSAQLGLNPALWETMDDVLTSMNEVSAAINKLRSVASDLGTSYTIIQTRQNFTENLINVLQEGADNLTLADMNEESANMLALQTRQMLGVNSLSLAAQAAQSVLQLF